jgi:serine/threonine kinase 32
VALQMQHHRIVSVHRLTVAVNLNHFRLLRVVGKGAFGKVRIVERKDTGLTFALKYIRKDESA